MLNNLPFSLQYNLVFLPQMKDVIMVGNVTAQLETAQW